MLGLHLDFTFKTTPYNPTTTKKGKILRVTEVFAFSIMRIVTERFLLSKHFSAESSDGQHGQPESRTECILKEGSYFIMQVLRNVRSKQTI